MKKIIASLIIAAAGIGAASAQVGETRIGIDLGVAPCIEKDANVNNFTLDAKVQVGLPLDLRVEAKLGYGFRDNYISAFTAEANLHYMIDVLPRFQMYPLVGIGYGRPKASIWGYSESLNRFLLNVGVGGEVKITSRFSAGIELKYQYMDDFQRFPVSVGVTYAF